MNLNELRDKAYKTACEHGFLTRETSIYWEQLKIRKNEKGDVQASPLKQV